ncbi:hypothetical protein TWF281_002334 [Arthrobotrys megalospora]
MNEKTIRSANAVWLPIDEKSAFNCLLDPQEIQKLGIVQFQFFRDVLECLNTKDKQEGSQWVMVSAWRDGGAYNMYLVVRNVYLDDQAKRDPEGRTARRWGGL